MGTNAFAEFVASQQPTPEEAEIDWGAERDQFLRELDLLYRQVDDFLQEYLAEGSVTRAFSQVSLTEENLGTYVARRMDITIGRQIVSLDPIGTLLIGSKGRVDVVGSSPRAQIWLVNAKVKRAADIFKVKISVVGGESRGLPAPVPPPASSEPILWAWKIATRSPKAGFIELDKESFFSLLMEVANG